MYWFTIYYYDNSPEQYVKPVVCTDNHALLIYAATPQQATEMAWEIIPIDPKYVHHLAKIGTLSSCVHESEMGRWNAEQKLGGV